MDLTATLISLVLCAAFAQDADKQQQVDPPPEPEEQDELSEELDDMEDIDLLDLDISTVVVTAGRRAQDMRSLPYAISVITADQIRKSGARSVPDALRLVPGVDVADMSYGNAAVSPRGLHGLLTRHVLVLVDGRQIFDSHFGGTLWGMWPFQLEDIERIEVIRGPGGVTWGANAVNGVINVITKDPEDQQGLTYRTRVGSRGVNLQHLGYATGDDKFRLRLSGEYEGTDGFVRGGSLLRSYEDDYKAARFGFHSIYQPNEQDRWTFSLGHGSTFDSVPPTPLGGFLAPEKRAETHTNFAMVKYDRTDEDDAKTNITFYFNSFIGSAGIAVIDYHYQQYALQFGRTIQVDDHTISFGVDTRLDRLDGGGSDPYMFVDDHLTTGIIGVYVRDEWRFAPRWQLDLGARIDYEFYGGFEPSARGALSYELSDDATAYFAISRAFQMIPLGLRFTQMPLLDGLAVVQGRQDASSEHLTSFEFGYRATFFESLDAAVNVFWHEYDDMTTISNFSGPPGLLRIDFANRAEASLYGVELDLRYEATEQWDLLANYTYQHLDWRSGAPLHDKDALSAPEHKFMIGSQYDLTEDLNLSSYLYFVDSSESPHASFPFLARKIDAYFRWDIRAEYEFWDDRAAVAVGVQNLLDDHHEEGGTLFLNRGEVPRMVFAELRINF